MQVTASKKQIWTAGSYSLLTLSIMVGFMYLNAFATEVLKIPASTLATVLLIAKSIDFIVSMFGGVIIEKVKMGNKGKYQGWLNVGRWILFICIAVEVFPTAGPVWLRCLIMAAGYTVLNSLMNLIQTDYYGIIGIVAGPNPANRSAMTVNMTRQGTVVTLITSFIPTLVSKLQFGQWNYFIVALVFALPMPFALGAIAKMADGKDQPIVKGGAAAGAPRITIKDMIDCLIHNPMLLVLFLVNVILNIGNNILSNQNVYYWLYVAGDFSKMTVNSLFMAFVAFFAAIIMPKLGAKLGKRGAMCFGYIWSAVSFFLRWYVARFGWVWMMISNAVAAVGMYALRHAAVDGRGRVVPQQDRQGYPRYLHGSRLSPDEDRHGRGRHHRSEAAGLFRLCGRLHARCRLGDQVHERRLPGARHLRDHQRCDLHPLLPHLRRRRCPLRAGERRQDGCPEAAVILTSAITGSPDNSRGSFSKKISRSAFSYAGANIHI